MVKHDPFRRPKKVAKPPAEATPDDAKPLAPRTDAAKSKTAARGRKGRTGQ